jgi:Tol biopolymer transport system component
MAGLRQFEWIDRDGHEIAKLGVPFAEARSPSLSPDENSVVFVDDAAGSRDIWQLDCQRGVTERMTTDPGAESQPIWSPDGARLIYVSSYSSTSGLLSLPIRGGAPEVLLHSSEQFPNIGAEDWSKDGRFVLFNGGAGQRRADDIWVLPLDPPGEPTPFAVTAFAEGDGQFSPDGDWIAYTSDESGQPEVYLGRFRGPQERIKISTNGGGMARWRRDGRELFYLAPDGRLMSVRVEPTSDDSLQVSAPVALFEARIGPPLQGNSSQQYMVAADGKRFLLNRIAEQNPPPITVLLNWQPAIH